MKLNKCGGLLFCLLFICIYNSADAQPEREQLTVSTKFSAASFPLAAIHKSATIYLSNSEASVVHIAVESFQKDIQLVTDIKIPIDFSSLKFSSLPVIVGTIGKSDLINQLVNNKKLLIDSIKGKWETFVITVVDHPFENVEKALCIIGSDSRGTAYGLFELSRKIGVSPWVWWADVRPKHKDALYITKGNSIVQSPSVQYRGIFLNDED